MTMSRRAVLSGAAFAIGAVSLASTSTVAQSVSSAQPVADPSEDTRRLAFARSLLGTGKKVVRRNITIRNTRIEYAATLGAIELRAADGAPSAVFVYLAYVRIGAESKMRPVTFAWGGGPSVASTSFHFDSFGPRLRTDEPKGEFVDNPESILDRTDLVFVDPMGTGWTMPAQGRDYGDFYSVAKDAAAVSQFIQRYLAEADRSDAPLYLAGRSYGTVRLASVVHFLKEAGIRVTGAIPVAAAMDGNAFWESSGNMASFYLMVPNYAAIAWHHNRQVKRARSAEAALEEAAEFALGDYLTALMTWQDLSAHRRQRVLKRLHALTGINQQVWADHHLRVNGRIFATELLKDERKVLQSSDARIARTLEPTAGASSNAVSVPESYVDRYARDELGIDDAPIYRMFAPGLIDARRVWPVDRRGLYELGSFKMNCLPNFLDDLAEAMVAHPTMRIQQHSGIFDLQSTSFPGNWSLRNMSIPDDLRRNVEMFDYAAGHAIYDSPGTFEQFMRNIASFYPQRS